MEENQTKQIFRLKIIELEDRLMDLIEVSVNYENIPIPIFEHEMDEILRKIEYLENLIYLCFQTIYHFF